MFLWRFNNCGRECGFILFVFHVLYIRSDLHDYV
jgi:hypothetical protein